MTIALHERGLFTWAEWAAALSAEVGDVGAAADGSDYYARWLRALEGLLEQKGVASPTEVEAMTQAWHRAAHATPHGQAIVLP
jgi:nitrile hydratase accessory protein